MERTSKMDRKSAQLVHGHISRLTCVEFRDLSRRLVLYAARLLRGASLDHHAYEVVTGAMDRALDGRRVWDPHACSFEAFLFGVVRSRASTLRRSPAAQVVRIAAQLPMRLESTVDVLAELADANLHAHALPSIEAEQELERLALKIAKIDATLAKILIMAFYEGRSNLDIVAMLNVSIRDVENGKKRLHRALKKLHPMDLAEQDIRIQVGGIGPDLQSPTADRSAQGQA